MIDSSHYYRGVTTLTFLLFRGLCGSDSSTSNLSSRIINGTQGGVQELQQPVTDVCKDPDLLLLFLCTVFNGFKMILFMVFTKIKLFYAYII